MLRIKERTSIPSSMAFTFELAFESFKEFWGCVNPYSEIWMCELMMWKWSQAWNDIVMEFNGV
jgi:hypothetical protein